VPLPAFHRSPSVAAPGAGADTRATYVQVSTYGATQSQPAAKRPRLDDAAARRQPNPLGAPVPSALTHPELRVMPGEVDEVVVESSEAWIGAPWTYNLELLFKSPTTDEMTHDRVRRHQTSAACVCEVPPEDRQPAGNLP
jgi:hypothetical protein